MTTSAEVAAQSRQNEAEVLSGKSRRVVICGREYTFLQPARRENRLMFADMCRIQQIAGSKENRVKALMEMFNFLIDWHPLIAQDEAKIDDAVKAELVTGKSVVSKEIAAAWKEVATLVSAPFQRTPDSVPEAENATSSPTSTTC